MARSQVQKTQHKSKCFLVEQSRVESLQTTECTSWREVQMADEHRHGTELQGVASGTAM